MNTAEKLVVQKPSASAAQASFVIHYKVNKPFIYICFAIYSAFLMATFKESSLLHEPAFSWRLLSIAILFFSPYLYLLSRPGLLISRPPLEILFENASILLPKQRHSRRLRSLSLTEISGCMIRGKEKNSELIIESKNSILRLPQEDFVDPSSLRDFYLKISERIRERDAEHAEMLLSREQRSQQQLRLLPKTSSIFCLFLLLGFLWQQAMTGGASFLLPGMGANSHVFFENGEWFRLLSSAFLHSGIVHLTLNIAGIMALGYIIEILYGANRTLLIITLSILAGSLCSALSGTLLSIGASGAIFGLLGVYFYVHLQNAQSLPIGLRMPPTWWIYVVLVNIALSLFIPRIDWLAHAAGFFCGTLLAYLLDETASRSPAEHKSIKQHSYHFAAIVSVLTIVASFTHLQLFASNKEWRSEKNVFIMKEFLKRDSNNAEALNDFAWRVAIHKSSNPAILKIAEKAALLAIEKEESDHFLDTLATAWYRLGKTAKATALEAVLLRRAEKEKDITFFASQLVRFSEALKVENRSLAQDTFANVSFSAATLLDNTPAGFHVFTALSKSNKKVIVLVEIESTEQFFAPSEQLTGLSDFRFVRSISSESSKSRVRVFPFSPEVSKLARVSKKVLKTSQKQLLQRPAILSGQILS